MKFSLTILAGLAALSIGQLSAVTLDVDVVNGESAKDLRESGVRQAGLSWGYRAARRGVSDDVFTTEVGSFGQMVIADSLKLAQFFPYLNLGGTVDLSDEDGDVWEELERGNNLVIRIPGKKPMAMVLGNGLQNGRVFTHGRRKGHYSTEQYTIRGVGNGEVMISAAQSPSDATIPEYDFAARGAKGKNNPLISRADLVKVPESSLDPLKSFGRTFISFDPPGGGGGGPGGPGRRPGRTITTIDFCELTGTCPGDNPVPEPSSALLLVSAGVAGLLRRRR